MSSSMRGGRVRLRLGIHLGVALLVVAAARSAAGEPAVGKARAGAQAAHGIVATASTAASAATDGALSPASRRVALVIGNGNYEFAPLPNPANDARAMAGLLSRMGFAVTHLQDANQAQMLEAIRSFGDSLGGGTGLFYFAGHGVQIEGRNYLIPVGAPIRRPDEVRYQSVDANLILDKMQSARNPMNIVILDACRNDPFARASRSIGGGLAQMDAPAGSIIAFATAPGAEAEDGTGRNGLYTGHLIEHMSMPGLPVEEVFKRTRAAVRQTSQGRQIPWESTSLEGSFFFVPATVAKGASGSVAATVAPAASEGEVWNMIRDTDSASAFRAYLERFPDGGHAAEARRRLDALTIASQSRDAIGPAIVPGKTSATGTTASVPGGPAPQHSAARAGRAEFSFSREEARMDQESNAGRIAIAEERLANIPCARPPGMAIRVRSAPDGAAGDAYTSLLTAQMSRAGVGSSVAGGYRLDGTVSAQARRNAALGLNEVTLASAIVLATGDGRVISRQVGRDDSFAGTDVGGALQELMQRQSAEIAAKLLAEACRS